MGTGEEPPARRQNGGRRRRWMGDGDDDDDEDFVAEEEEEEEEDLAEELPASSAGEEGEDSDAEYKGEEEEVEEEEETPRPKRPVKGGASGGRKGKRDPATARAKRRRYEVDDDYEEEPSEDEEFNGEDEVEEYDEDEETPRPLKGGTFGRKGKVDPATARSRQPRRYDVDDDYVEEPDEDEEPDYDEEAEEYHEDIEEEEEEEEEEEAPSQRKRPAKCSRRGQNVELARSHRRKYEDENMDFEPELDGEEEEEEEVEEDIDFDPELDDEDEFEDEEEEEFSAAHARKVTVKNPAKRKSGSKRRSLKKKKANKGSKASRRKKGSAKSKKSAPIRRVRKRFVVDDSDEDSDDDDDFIVDDPVMENRHPRKKARTGTSKPTELEHPSFEEDAWPNVESETSEFEFVTSDDDEPDDAGTAVVEDSSTRKRRKKRRSVLESSSDSEFVLSDKELENLEPSELPKPHPVLLTPIRKNSVTRHGVDKGKEKEEPEEAGKPICGICLSEEQRATVQGVLNCCSHYFCFACIMEWSRVESRCPLCKQRFTTITKSSKADLGLGLRKAVIKVEERDQVYQPTEEEIRRWLDPYENVVCIECNQGGDDSLMLLCDICDSSAHTYCVGLGREVPEGNWYCGGCRLSDEGPSHARIPHTVGYERQSSRSHVDFSSVGFGVAAQNGTYDRSLTINRHRSFQGFDLNLSPREAPGETHLVESQVSTDSVSTPTGRRATVSGRRQIHRYIRFLLSRPRPVTSTRPEDMLPSFVSHNGAVPINEPNRHSFRSPSEANTSQIPDGIQNQHDGHPFAPSMPLDGDDFQHIEGVKSNLRNMQ